jgi:hypothetical protein
MPTWSLHRTVVEESEVQRNVDDACKTLPRARDAWDGLCWLLARKAETLGAPHNPGSRIRLYVMKGSANAGIPDIWVVFELTENEVNVKGVKFHGPAD